MAECITHNFSICVYLYVTYTTFLFLVYPLAQRLLLSSVYPPKEMYIMFWTDPHPVLVQNQIKRDCRENAYIQLEHLLQ
jgi:hypothetical protein